MSNSISELKSLSMAEKRVLVAGLLRKKAERQRIAPLSFAQQRLWFLDQMEPGNSAYNIQAAVRFKGDLNINALERGLNEIIRRHEALRTAFAIVDNQPAQMISPSLVLSIPVIDLSPAAEGLQEAEAARLIAEDGRQAFNLRQGPLVRAMILRLTDKEHIFLLTTHHIVSDGWSLGLLFKELGALYGAYSKLRPSPLPDLPIQYADFAAWQRDWLEGGVLARQTAFWQQQLSGAPALLKLPTDRPRPAKQTFNGAKQSVLLPLDLTARLKSFSQREGVTLFMTLLAAFKTLIYRHTGQEDIVVGTGIANRNRAEIEELIGFFVNTLALRTDLSGNVSFLDLLKRVREVTLGAYAHQDLPFDKLVESLRPDRNPGYTPLCQVIFTLQNAPFDAVEFSGLKLSNVETQHITAKFDLTFLLAETARGLLVWVEYNTDLFNSQTISRLLGSFETLLGSILAQPDARLNALEILTEGEKKKSMIEKREREQSGFNRFKRIKPKAITLPEGELVRMGSLLPGQNLPLVIEPAVENMDLLYWAKDNLSSIERLLVEHGALLLRGFSVDSASAFERFVSIVCPDLFNENGEHPRQTVSGNVYTPVFYPPNKHLLWHNENSFNHKWPMKISFCCLQPAQEGGETPIVDSRRVFQKIDPKIRERFIRKQVMYMRNYGNGLGLNWDTVFQTSSKAEVEERCRQSRMLFEWKDGNRLKTRSIRPAVIKHPVTGEDSWFNQAQHWHISCLDSVTRESITSLLKEEEFPRNCYYGDGSPIEDSIMEEILAVYSELEVTFTWLKGDVLILDNILTAHARNPFEGERKLLVAMGQMGSY